MTQKLRFQAMVFDWQVIIEYQAGRKGIITADIIEGADEIFLGWRTQKTLYDEIYRVTKQHLRKVV